MFRRDYAPLISANKMNAQRHDFFFLSSDKQLVEVDAANAMNAAILSCRSRLLAKGSAVCTKLASHLNGLHHPFSADQRGNARQLCAMMRLFAEEAHQSTRPIEGSEEGRTLAKRCMELRLRTRWASHSPLTRSRLEYLSHTRYRDSTTQYVLTEITFDNLVGTAQLLMVITEDVLRLDAVLVVAPATWTMAPIESLEAAASSLNDRIASVKAGFMARAESMGVGKYGRTSIPVVCTFHGHALLCFEAAEHLVVSKSDKPRGVQELVMGVRMFAETVWRAVYKMPLGHLSLPDLWVRSQDLMNRTMWAGHPESWWQDNWPKREGLIVVDGPHLEAVAQKLQGLADDVFALLAYFQEPSRAAVLALAQYALVDAPVGSADADKSWKAALYLGLALKDVIEPASVAGGASGAAAAAGPSGSDDDSASTLHVYGAVCFPYLHCGIHYRHDSAAMLEVAEKKLRAEVAAAASQDGTCRDGPLLDYQAVAIKELVYVLSITEAHLSEAQRTKVPQVEKRRVSKEITMRRLGSELLWPLAAPPTAAQRA